MTVVLRDKICGQVHDTQRSPTLKRHEYKYWRKEVKNTDSGKKVHFMLLEGRDRRKGVIPY